MRRNPFWLLEIAYPKNPPRNQTAGYRGSSYQTDVCLIGIEHELTTPTGADHHINC
jgi:hypothetical protein